MYSMCLSNRRVFGPGDSSTSFTIKACKRQNTHEKPVKNLFNRTKHHFGTIGGQFNQPNEFYVTANQTLFCSYIFGWQCLCSTSNRPIPVETHHFFNSIIKFSEMNRLVFHKTMRNRTNEIQVNRHKPQISMWNTKLPSWTRFGRFKALNLIDRFN